MVVATRALLRGLGSLMFLGLLAGPALAQVNLVQNYSFETLGQVGWTPVLNEGNPGTVHWLDSPASPPRTDGANGLTSSQSFIGSQVLYQDIVLPPAARFSIQVAAGCNFSGSSSAYDFCRVDITDTSAASIIAPVPGTDSLATTGGNVLQAIYSRDSIAGSQAQTDTAAVDISGLAGQTVRVRVMVSDLQGPVAIALDNVRLLQISRTVPALSPWAMLIMASLLTVAAGLALPGRKK
jgi:hypothetical protein